MKAIFIADAHLRSRKDPGYERLIRFLDSLQGGIDHLFILGDFFDFWFGRGESIYPDFRPVIDRLIGLKKAGARICLFEGNHDFHLGRYFTGEHAIEVVEDWAAIELGGRRLYLAHGDLVDDADTGYLLLRKALRSGTFQKIQALIPQAVLWKAAGKSSRMSKEWPGESRERLFGKMERFSMQKFSEGFDAVILAHCHTPALKKYVHEGRERTFATLGDWVEHFSYLVFEDGQFTLSFDDSGPISRKAPTGPGC